MDKKSDLGSSLYFSEKSGGIRSSMASKHRQRAPNIKVQIVNQNLQDAIKQVRNNVKENPQWHLHVKAVSSQYKPKKQPMAIINQSQQERPGVNVLPQSKREPQINTLQDSRTIDFKKLKFTERMKNDYLQRLKNLKEKRMQLEVVSLQKKMRAKLQRKVRQNQSLKEKAKLIQDIQEKREDIMRLKDHQHLKKRQEHSLLHQSNIAKVQMLRRSKKRFKKKQINESLSRSQESKMSLKFKQFLVDKEKQERKEVLMARYRMIRSASQGSVRTRAQARNLQSIQSAKKFPMN